MRAKKAGSICVLIAALTSIGGCATNPFGQAYLSDRECMTRAMYFESNRSSEDGMVAVGTTVMNRLAAPGFPKTVCGVVGQPGQYAQGVLSHPMNPRERRQVEQVADAVLAGRRHPDVGGAMYFHTAGLHFPYGNMHYVAVAGGNAFYEKRYGPSIRYAAGASRPASARVATAEPWHVPGSIDDLLRISTTQPDPGSRRVSVANAGAPLQIHQ